MKLTNLIKILIICILILSCKSAKEKPGVLGLVGSSDELFDNSEVTLPSPELSKSVIRRAEIRIKVKDVKKSLNRYEIMAKSMGGFVENTNLESSELAGTSKIISEDSLLEVTQYSIYGNITIRVPVFYFDSVVNAIQNSALFLNFRKTSAEDIGLQYLSNKLKSETSEKSGDRIEEASSGKGKKLVEIVNAEQTASTMAENVIDRRITNLDLQQKANFSAIQVNLHQANQVYMEVITNINISDYKPAFSERFVHALKTGWNGLLAFFIFLMNLWPVYVVVLIVVIIQKAYKFTFSIKKSNP